jgi:hypothetical protein
MYKTQQVQVLSMPRIYSFNTGAGTVGATTYASTSYSSATSLGAKVVDYGVTARECSRHRNDQRSRARSPNILYRWNSKWLK